MRALAVVPPACRSDARSATLEAEAGKIEQNPARTWGRALGDERSDLTKPDFRSPNLKTYRLASIYPPRLGLAEGIVSVVCTKPVPVSVRRASVLVIDDEPVLLRGLKRSLSEHDVVTATSVSQGMQLYCSREFDIVFCDLMMPESSGLDFYEQLSELGPGHAERLVLMTGGVFADRLGCSLSQISSPCILKPFKHGEIEQLIHDALHRSG